MLGLPEAKSSTYFPFLWRKNRENNGEINDYAKENFQDNNEVKYGSLLISPATS
ncbi:hypothetical protein ACNKHO_09485 [Shigella flexneri]